MTGVPTLGAGRTHREAHGGPIDTSASCAPWPQWDKCLPNPLTLKLLEGAYYPRRPSTSNQKRHPMRLKIGEFARIGQVSVSAMRYYDEVGLLRPVEVDRWTGYRYYAFDQLGMLNRLLALKDLGLSLEQIRQLLGEELPGEQIKGMLRLKRAELQAQAQEINERLARVEARIEQIEMEGKMPDYEVIVKRVEPVRVALLRDVV